MHRKIRFRSAGCVRAGPAAAARSVQRAAGTRESATLAEARWRTDAAQFLSTLDSTANTLAAGGERRATVGPTVQVNGEVVTTKLRLLRIDARRFLLAVSTQVGPDDAVRARRRASILLETPAIIDSSAPTRPPVLVTHWAQHHLY